MADPKDALLADVTKLLNEIPFGTFEGRVIRHRSTTEEDIVLWVARAYELQRKLRGVPSEDDPTRSASQ